MPKIICYARDMTDTKPAALVAYDRVIAEVLRLHIKNTGSKVGAMAWFARELGVTSQTLLNWRDRAGFPPEKAKKAAQIIGWKLRDVRPETILVETDRRTWADICKRIPKRLRDKTLVHNRRLKGAFPRDSGGKLIAGPK